MLFLLAVLALLLVPIYIIYKPPSWLINHFQAKWPDILWKVSTSTKIVALTIDDGPSEYTTEIIEVLKENNAAATFFIIGSQVAGREETLVELVRSGNELANHAMYDEPSRKLSDADLTNQIHAVDGMLQTAYNSAGVHPPPKYFRPGSGFFTTRMRERVVELGYRLVLGSIYPHDPQIPYPAINGRHILSMLKPGGIIICHDRRSWTAPMLRQTLPEIRRRGYKILTVSELLHKSGLH
ncbi:nodulation protein nodB [Mycena capillaripes]|nr:nodulation protein nodB [Mycena capillaripes]